VLGRLHQKGRIVLFGGVLCCQSFQQLLQVKFGIGIGLGQFCLQRFRFGPWVGADFAKLG
jgi:hypothetical protein